VAKFILTVLVLASIAAWYYGVFDFKKTETGYQVTIEKEKVDQAVDDMNKAVDKVQESIKDKTK